MAFTHYKIGARSGPIWTATQVLYKFLPLAQDDILLITGTPNDRILRTCEKAVYRRYSKASEVPAGIQEMRILCDYDAVDAVYEPDTFIGTLIWNREYWQETIGWQFFTTLTLLLARALSRAGVPEVETLSGSRGVVAGGKKVGNIAESNEMTPPFPLGWNSTHLFAYLTMDHALMDRMIDKQAYSRCISMVAPWQTYFAGLKELKPDITQALVANALETEVSLLFGVPAQAGNILKLIRYIPNGAIARASSRDFIENGGKEGFDNA